MVSVPKAGHAEDENEDAAAVTAESWPVRAAVADGATEAVFSKLWAEILVTESLSRAVETPDALRSALPTWQTTWQSRVGSQVQDLPWYAAAKVADGAFATLLVLALEEDGLWRAVAVGDSVLLHVRDDTLLRAWPLDDPDAFDDRPPLLPSRAGHPVPNPRHTHGAWQPGDAFLIATDAVAAWLLRSDPATALGMNAGRFRERVQTARDEGMLRNDDSTLIWVKV